MYDDYVEVPPPVMELPPLDYNFFRLDQYDSYPNLPYFGPGLSVLVLGRCGARPRRLQNWRTWQGHAEDGEVSRAKLA